MVVFIDGEPRKRLYRRFRIKSADGSDDYGSMYEVLRRRFLRREETGWPPPNLLVVDGGRGHVNVALRVLRELGVDNVDLIGLSKGRSLKKKGVEGVLDAVIIPRLKEPLRLAANDPVLLLLQRLRDQAHATAVEYQRKVRKKSKLASSLERIPGVGDRLRRNLISHFSSVGAVRKASVEELLEVSLVGPVLARKIHAYFHSRA